MKIIISALFSFVCWSSFAQTISTVAGGGIPTSLEPLAAKRYKVSFTNPMSIALDKHGRLYWGGLRVICRADLTNLKIDTVAGTGASGYAGDGILAKDAHIDGAQSLVFDGDDNYYFVHFFSNVIRRVDGTTGVITTCAGTGQEGYSGDGGPATAAKLRTPMGLAVDPLGNLYFHDRNNFVIRRIAASTKIITTFAGTGVAGNGPDGVAATSTSFGANLFLLCDPLGNVYVNDASNHKVRKIDVSTGLVTTVAGTGSSGFSGDGGPATSATLNSPSSISFNSSGDLFINDGENYRIRKVDQASQQITTIAGTGSRAFQGSFNGDNGPAAQARIDSRWQLCTSADGSIFILEALNAWIRRIAPTGQVKILVGDPAFEGENVPATNALLNSPTGVTVSDGKLLIADQFYHKIRMVNISSGYISTIAGTGNDGGAGDNSLATDAELYAPFQIKADGAGDLFIADFANSAVRKVNRQTGIITTVAGKPSNLPFGGDGGQALDAFFFRISSIAFDPDGNLTIVDRENHRIRKVNRATGIVSTIAGTGMPGFSGDGGLATSAQLNGPTSIAFDSNGNLYISDRLNNRVRKVEKATGKISTAVGNGTTALSVGAPLNTGLNLPYGLVFDADDNLFFADAGHHRILRMDAQTSEITTYAGNGTLGFSGDNGSAVQAQLNFPRDVALGSDGILYVADAGNNRVRKITPALDTPGPSNPGPTNPSPPVTIPNTPNPPKSESGNPEPKDPVTGTENSTMPPGNAIYPNPVSSKLYLAPPGAVHGSVQFTITDVLGNTMVSGKEYFDGNSINVDVSQLISAVYILQAAQGNKIWTLKFLKK